MPKYLKGESAIQGIAMTPDRNPDPEEFVTRAIMKNEYEKLLLGEAEYQFLPFYSPADRHDLTMLLGELRERAKYNKQISVKMTAAIMNIIDHYEGLDPAATCLLCEASNKARNIGLPLEEIANRLAQSINFHKERLHRDRSGHGAQFDDGKYGEMRRMSKITQKYGGPGFVGPKGDTL